MPLYHCNPHCVQRWNCISIVDCCWFEKVKQTVRLFVMQLCNPAMTERRGHLSLFDKVKSYVLLKNNKEGGRAESTRKQQCPQCKTVLVRRDRAGQLEWQKHNVIFRLGCSSGASHSVTASLYVTEWVSDRISWLVSHLRFLIDCSLFKINSSEWFLKSLGGVSLHPTCLLLHPQRVGLRHLGTFPYTWSLFLYVLSQCLQEF